MKSSRRDEKIATHRSSAPNFGDSERCANEAQGAVNYYGDSDREDVPQRQSLARSLTNDASDYPANDFQGHRQVDYGFRYPPFLPPPGAQLQLPNDRHTRREVISVSEKAHRQSIPVKNNQGLHNERVYQPSHHPRSQDPQPMRDTLGRRMRYVDQDDQYHIENYPERETPPGSRDEPLYSLWPDGANPNNRQNLLSVISNKSTQGPFNVSIGEPQASKSSSHPHTVLPEPSIRIESSPTPSVVAPKIIAPSGSGRLKRKRTEVEEADTKLEDENELRDATDKKKAKRKRSGGKNKTLEERQFLYHHDHWAKEVTGNSVICKGCTKVIGLDGRKKDEYYGSGWTKHRSNCRAIYFKMEVICIEFGRDFSVENAELHDQFWEEDWCTYLVDKAIRNVGGTIERKEPTWLKVNKLAAQFDAPELTKGGRSGPRLIHYFDESYQVGSYSRGFVKRIPNARARIEAINKNATAASG